MSGLSKKERFKILEMVTEIASEAAKNPSVVSMIEFQEELVVTLYHTMVALVEHDDDDDDFAERTMTMRTTNDGGITRAQHRPSRPGVRRCRREPRLR